MRKVFIIVLLAINFHLLAQSDTTFWFAAPDISEFHGDSPVVFRLATFDKAAKVKISFPATGVTIAELNIDANSAKSFASNFPDFLETKVGLVNNKGILIQSTAQITAYYEVLGNYRGNNTDIFALKGKYALGNDFVVPFQNKFINQTRLDAYSIVTVAATENITTVKFILNKAIYLYPNSDTITVKLNKGQSYAFQALSEQLKDKLAGVHLISDKPIVVTGSDDSVLDSGGWDLIGDQIIPLKNAGTLYAIPAGLVAVAAKNPVTFTIGSQAFSLDQTTNFSTTFNLLTPTLVQFSDTVVINFIDNYSGNATELGGAILPPINCSGSREVVFTRNFSESNGKYFYMYLVFRTVAKDSFLLNNVPFDVEEYGDIQTLDANLSFAKIEVPEFVVPVSQAMRIKNTLAPFHLGIANGGGGNDGGFQLGYFSNFKNELKDTFLLCERYQKMDDFVKTLDLYGTIKTDTILKLNADSTRIRFQITDEYCVQDDSAWVIQSPTPVILVPDSISLCQNIDSTLSIDEHKVIFQDFFAQKTWQIKQDSIKIYVENKAECSAEKTVYVDIKDSLSVVFPKDTSFCDGELFNFQFKGNFDSLFINAIPIKDTIAIKNDSIVFIRAKNECQSKIDTLKVEKIDLPTLDLGLDRELCTQDKFIRLSPIYSYKWQDAKSDSVYEITKSGDFWVEAKDANNCIKKDSVVLVYKNFSPIDSLRDSKICPNELLSIDLAKGHDSYRWNDGLDTNKRLLGLGNYELKIETKANDTSCYVANYQFVVSEWNLFLPNAITPNNDKKNENFVIGGLDAKYPTEIEIFNRWGAEVYSSLNYQNDWGIKDDLSDGLYYYHTQTQDFKCTENKGFILILR
jgi:gliding motility-associated-like protein